MPLQPNEVTTITIAPGAVTTPKIGELQITSSKLQDKSVSTEKIANQAITAYKIGEQQVTTSRLKDAAVTTPKIADGAVTSAKITNGAVVSDKILDASVINTKIADRAVRSEKLEVGAVTAEKIGAGAVITAKIAANAVGASQLAVGSVIAEKIAKAEEDLLATNGNGNSGIDLEELRAFEEKMYGDIWNKEDYLNWLYERLLAIREVMSEAGSIYVHLDWHMGHYIKVLIDEIFGQEKFKNEIVVSRIKKSDKNIQRFNTATDMVLFYTKSNQGMT